MSPVNSVFLHKKKKKKLKKKLSANLFLKWPISIIGKMLNIGADNRSTPTVQRRFKSNTPNVRTQAEHEKHCATRQSEGFSICTSPLFTMIYCSNIHYTMVLWQKCGIFTFNIITGVMVYNYSKYVWLRQL